MNDRKTCITVFLVIILLYSTVFHQEKEQNHKQITKSSYSSVNRIYAVNNSSIISISNNNDFLLYSFSGYGTVEIPYLIENLTISNSTSNLISIMDTDVHFIIQNNYLDGITGDNYGISLENVTNCQIINNIIINSDSGIMVFDSSFNFVLNNEIYNNTDKGLMIDSFSFNNTFFNNKIFNIEGTGIIIDSVSFYNNISNNAVYNCNLGLFISSAYTFILNNTISSNNNGIMFDQGGGSMKYSIKK